MELPRRLLQSGPPPSNICINATTGQTYLCVRQQYPVLVIIVAGIVSMVFLVSVALILLMCSFYKRRGPTDQQPAESQVAPSSAAASEPAAPANVLEDVYLVYMPGDEPAIFARPVPFIKEPAAEDCTSNGEHGGDAQAAPAVADKRKAASQAALEVPRIAAGGHEAAVSRQRSFSFRQLPLSSASPRQGFRFARHASLRLDHSASVSSLLAEARSSSFPRREADVDSFAGNSDVWRGNQNREFATLTTGSRGEIDVVPDIERHCISGQGSGSSRFQRIQPHSPSLTPSRSNHISLRFESRAIVASLLDRARSFSFPRRGLDGHLVPPVSTDNRACVMHTCM